MLQEYDCTGMEWGVRQKRIFEYRCGWGVQKWQLWGVCTLWMAPLVFEEEPFQVILRKTIFVEKWPFSTFFGQNFRNFNISTRESY